MPDLRTELPWAGRKTDIENGRFWPTVMIRGGARKLTFGNAPDQAAELTEAIAETSPGAFSWTLDLMGAHHGIQAPRRNAWASADESVAAPTSPEPMRPPGDWQFKAENLRVRSSLHGSRHLRGQRSP